MSVIKVGNAGVRIEAEGCIDCGSIWMPRGEVARIAVVTVATIFSQDTQEVAIYRCRRCVRVRQAELEPMVNTVMGKLAVAST